MNCPFCFRASRFTTSIRSDRAEMYQFFRHEIGGKTMGKIMKKNIMMLQMPEKLRFAHYLCFVQDVKERFKQP